MIFTWSFLLLLLVAAAFGQKFVDCTANAVTVRWRPILNSALKLDLSKAHLGSCPPSSLSLEDNTLLFSVWLHDCGFTRLVSKDNISYRNQLIYSLDSGFPPITEPVQCVYQVSNRSAELDNRKNNLSFTLGLMNSDFNGPAPSTVFIFGSRIPIRAKVEHRELEPIQIYLQRCMLANAPDLSEAIYLHALISDAGCLKESKEGNAEFLPRRDPSEISLYFQAFPFALGGQVFLHCDVTIWDLQRFNVEKKACQYLHNRWELLDDPTQSSICSCCESVCMHQSNFLSDVSSRQVLGPFTMVDSQSDASDEFKLWRNGQEMDVHQLPGPITTVVSEPSASDVPVWLVALAVFLVLIFMAGAIAMCYYLCFWRGGRLGYRPSRELMNKY